LVVCVSDGSEPPPMLFPFSAVPALEMFCH
jgi:hypothetical protein